MELPSSLWSRLSPELIRAPYILTAHFPLATTCGIYGTISGNILNYCHRKRGRLEITTRHTAAGVTGPEQKQGGFVDVTHVSVLSVQRCDRFPTNSVEDGIWHRESEGPHIPITFYLRSFNICGGILKESKVNGLNRKKCISRR